MNETNNTFTLEKSFSECFNEESGGGWAVRSKNTPTIIVLKTLLETENSYMYEFFSFTHVKWSKVKNAMQEHVKKYVAEKHEEEGYILKAALDEKRVTV